MRQRLALPLLLALVLFLWEGLHQLEVFNPVLVSAPRSILAALYLLAQESSAWADLGFSLQVLLLSLVFALSVGTALGLVIGFNRGAYTLLNPLVVAANSLPKVVLMPLIVLWLGIGMAANVFLGALMASFPIITATFSGVRALEDDALGVARAFGASRMLTLRRVVLPGILPYLLSGLRVALNYAMVGVLISEFFASSQGIGYRMVLYMANFEIASFYACLLIVVSFTLAMTALVSRLEGRVLRGRRGELELSRGL